MADKNKCGITAKEIESKFGKKIGKTPVFARHPDYKPKIEEKKKEEK